MDKVAIYKPIKFQYITIIVLSIIFGWIAGYRPFGFGRDFINYYNFYSTLSVGDSISYYRFEPAFVISAMISKHILGLSFELFVTILTAISLFIKLNVLKKLDHPFLAILFYLSVWYPLHENTQIRTAFALSILFLALKPMLMKQWIRFSALAAVSICFHYSAAMVVIILLFSNLLANYRMPIAIIVIFVSGSIVNQSVSFLSDIFELINPLYRSGYEEFEKPNIFSINNILTFFLIIFSWVSGNLKCHRKRVISLVTICGLMVFLLFSSEPVLSHRLKEMILVFTTLIAFEYRFSLKKSPMIICSFAISIYSLYLSISSGLF